MVELAKIARLLNKEGKTVVHCHGVFDLLHPGHIRHFEAAKREGDVLVVTLHEIEVGDWGWVGIFPGFGWLADEYDGPYLKTFEIGADLGDVERVRRIIDGHRVIKATNALGVPSVVLPVGVERGLPQSAQLIGARYHESLCLDAAEAIEQRLEGITPIDPRAASDGR